MDVSVVMINYDTFELTKIAIESIVANTSGLSYEIVLIDNASPDGSGKKLYEYFGDKVIYIQAVDNLGTSKAFNIGVKRASGKYVLWLNTDIVIYDNFIGTLFNYMETNLDCAICGGNLVDSNGNPTHSFCMKLPSIKTRKESFSIMRILFNKVFHSQIKKQYNFDEFPKEVGYITGADMMMRKSVIDALGGFDEDIFMYAEESEFTFRVKDSTKYKVMSVPAAKMKHLEGGSFEKSSFNERRFATKLDGDSIYFKKCYGLEEMIKFLRQELNGYKKLLMFNRFLFCREKIRSCKAAIAIIDKKIKAVRSKT